MSLNQEFSLIQTNGIALHVVLAGPPDGPPVILLHGFPEYWFGWRHQIRPLGEAGFRVLAPDQRGYNLSDKPKGISAYRIDVLARDVVGLIDSLGREKASLVGHDWGGLVAWAAAVLYPERVDKLVAINAPYPLIGFWTVFRDPTQIPRSAYILFFQIPVFPEAILRNNNWELLVRLLRQGSRPGTFSDEDIERYRRAWWKRDSMTSMLNWYRALLQRPARLPWEPRITLPTLILWGVQDPALSRKMAEMSLDRCENGRLVFYEDATHWVQHEKPGEINRQIIEFLR